jgi:hypothetical protein
MPSTRQAAQRKVNSAGELLDNAATHLFQVGEVYAEAHPEIAGPIAQVITLLSDIQELIFKVRDML